MKINFLKKKNEIENWLKNYNIQNYTLIEDENYGYRVNVNGDVSLYMPEEEDGLKIDITPLLEIPVKFGIVKGSFWCSGNSLTSLEFCPEVVMREFDCRFNKIDLLELEFIPKIVGTYFNCYGNEAFGKWQTEKNYSKILEYSNKIKEINQNKNHLEKILLPITNITIKKNKI